MSYHIKSNLPFSVVHIKALQAKGGDSSSPPPPPSSSFPLFTAIPQLIESVFNHAIPILIRDTSRYCLNVSVGCSSDRLSPTLQLSAVGYTMCRLSHTLLLSVLTISRCNSSPFIDCSIFLLTRFIKDSVSTCCICKCKNTPALFEQGKWKR